MPCGVGVGLVRRWWISRAMCRLRQRMISRRVLPSACRLRVYSMVGGSVRIRLVAIRHSALLAWRSPPRLSRCRTIRPEDAWTGLRAHSAAKDASVFIRLGVVAGGHQQRSSAIRTHPGSG